MHTYPQLPVDPLSLSFISPEPEGLGAKIQNQALLGYFLCASCLYYYSDSHSLSWSRCCEYVPRL